MQRLSINRQLGGARGLAVRNRPAFSGRLTRLVLNAKETDTDAKEDPAQITEKFGLEAGLFKAMTDKNADGQTKLSSAKDLLAKYGSAYLITSITLSIISFTLCYVLIDGGVDVAALLAKVGIEVSGTSEKVGTAALAYAAHKAASPIRFPPTVALTPLVAKYIGKRPRDEAPSA